MRLLRLRRLFVGAVLLVGAGTLALVVAAGGSTAGVDLVWPAVGLEQRTTALVLFLLGAGTLLVAETAVRLVLRALPPHPLTLHPLTLRSLTLRSRRRSHGRRAAR